MQGVTEACTDSEPTLSDDCGLEEVPGDICALCKRSLQKKTEYTELKKQKLLGDIKLQTLKRKKLQLEIKLLQKELQIKKQTHRTRMDPARLFPVSLQHPNPHQHLQQQYWQHLQHPGKEQPVVRSKPGHLPPILYPQIVLLHQTHCADQVYISSPEEVTTASQWTEVHAGSGGQGSMSCAKEDQKSKPHKGNPGHEADPGNEADLGSDADQGNEANTGNESKTPKENIPASLTEDCDSPGPTASLDEEAVNKHSVEECFSLLESFFDQLFLAQTKDTREEEHGEVGYPKLKIRSFLEYLDELCRDEEFVSKVESTAKMEALMSLLSAIQDLFEEQEQDLALVMIIARARSCYSKMLPQMILQEELPPCPPNSDHFYGETPLVSSQSLFLDAPGSLFASSPNRNGQNSSQNEVGISWSPLLLSNLLEEPPSPNHNPLDASDAFSQDDFFASILDRKAQTTAPL
ncbi:uncharacterized protein LOC120439227 [Oreochromis aureus]|uniref:uncharacterized protein LOC120439227 n=1 Tax=Oreochromis aureus TaxID=47969 RepID=UPI0019537311|nr:uncharacterized protein LOC120439227 [Oreochromis aureus]